MPFECLPYCGKCCGKVAFPEALFLQIIELTTVPCRAIPDLHLGTGESLVWPVGEDDRCAFLDRNMLQCNAHDYRPKVCRDFGMSNKIRRVSCPWVDPKGEKRTRQDTRRILRKTPHRLLRVER